MFRKVAYCVAGTLAPASLEPSTAWPEPDFVRFAHRNSACILSLNDVGCCEGEQISRLRREWSRIRLAYKAVFGGFDVIVASGEDIGVYIALIARALQRPVDVFIVTHGQKLESRWFRILFCLAAKSQRVTFGALSSSLRDHLISNFRFQNIVNIGYGFDAKFFDGKITAAEYLVSAGIANRDYDTLCKAVDGLDVQVRVASASTWSSSKIGSEKTTPNVTFQPAANYTDLRSLYARALIVIVPTKECSFASGLAVISEACGMGVPVIATSTSVLSDFIIDGETGLLVPPGDHLYLREAIVTLMQQPEFASKLGKQARAMMLERFTLDHYCEQIERACGFVTAEQ